MSPLTSVIKRTNIHLIILLMLALAMSCTQKSSTLPGERKVLTVSIEPQRQIVEAIAGEDFDVVSIMSRGANPETFETTMSQQALVSKSDVFFTLGMFPFEKAIASTLPDDTRIVDCSAEIALITDHVENHSHSHIDMPGHGCNRSIDPHYWVSLKNMKQIAATVTDALCTISPENKNKYQNRLDSLCALLDGVDTALRNKLNPLSKRSFAVWHPSLTYFASDYGLQQISLGYEGKDLSPKRIQQCIEDAGQDSISVLFYQKEFDSRQASTINEALGSRLVVIDPLAYDWINQLKIIADELTR